MGAIGQAIFGGSKNKQNSAAYNQAYPFLQQVFGGATGLTGQATGDISSFLSGDASGFNNYKNATGFNQLLEQGSRGITGGAAARGLLNSGSTGKALVNYGNDMQNQYAGSYLSNLFNLSNQGLQAGNLISGAGRTSESSGSGSSKPGISGLLGGLLV